MVPPPKSDEEIQDDHERRIKSIENLINKIKWITVGAIALFALETIGLKVIITEIFRR